MSQSQISLSGDQWQDKRQTEIQEIPLEHKKTTLSLWGWSSTFGIGTERNTLGTGCQEGFWSLHLWIYSKSDRTRIWAIYFSWPSFKQCVGLDHFQTYLPTSTFQWFCLPVDIPKDKKKKSWDGKMVWLWNLEWYLAIFHRITESLRFLTISGITFGYIKLFEKKIFPSSKRQMVPLGRGGRKDSVWFLQWKRKAFS